MDLVGAPRQTRSRHKQRAAILSVAVNLFLATLKVAVWAATGSLALLASSADSVLDLTASVFAFFGVRATALPPDDEHAYGHEKFEHLSSLVQLMLLFVTTGVIAAEAIRRLVTPGRPTAPWYGFAVIGLALVLDIWIGRRLRRASREVGGSVALDADALHFLGDVLGNIAVLGGLALIALAHVRWADPAAALLVAVFIGRTAFQLGQVTIGALVDRAPDPAVVQRLRETLESFVGVRQVHTLRAREAGGRIFCDVCVELDASLSFGEAHDRTHLMLEAMHRAVPNLDDAVIHAEPVGHPALQDHLHHHMAAARTKDSP
jgi:ferrous-iron efflux pump FieF